MGRLGKWFLLGVIALAGVLAIAITLTIGWRPLIGPKARPLTSRTFERTPQRLERGRYIATALSGCLYCHSHHDWVAPGMPMVPGTEGAGEIQPETDLPGRIVARNLTPDQETGAGNWTDDQLARSIREGIGHDGRALLPRMPYTHYREMSDEDVASVVVYLRSLPAVRRELPKTGIIFPVEYLIRSVPEPVTAPVGDDAGSDLVKRGAHLVKLAGCSDCHTPYVRGESNRAWSLRVERFFRALGEKSPARTSRRIRAEFRTTTRPFLFKPSTVDMSKFVRCARSCRSRSTPISPTVT